MQLTTRDYLNKITDEHIRNHIILIMKRLTLQDPEEAGRNLSCITHYFFANVEEIVNMTEYEADKR